MYRGKNMEHECGLAASLENAADTIREILAGAACDDTERDYASLLGYCKGVIEDALADPQTTILSVKMNRDRFRGFRWNDKAALARVLDANHAAQVACYEARQ